MPTDPREPTAVTVDTEVPRGLADTLLTALVEAAEDLGVGVIGTYRPTAEAQAELDELDRLRARLGATATAFNAARARVAEQDETIGELKEELALTQRVAAAADHLLAGREIQPTTINTWLAYRFRTGLEARTAELAAAQQRIAKLEDETAHHKREADLRLDLGRRWRERAEAAETQVRELTELNIKMAANGLTFGRQRDGAEAQVAAVRALLDGQPCHCAAPAQFGHKAECPRIRIHVHVIRRAIDAAGSQPARDEGWPKRDLADLAGRLDRLDQAQTAGPPYPEPETATDQPSTQVGQGANRPEVTDAMVQAAINGALDHIAPDGRDRDAHRRHTFSIWCDICQMVRTDADEIAVPARERVFRAALTAALGTPNGDDQ